MVRSNALLFCEKKSPFFIFNYFCHCKCFDFMKKCRKKLWCSFFWGQNDPENFFGFSEKSRKNRKKCVFFEKMLMVSPPFSSKVALPVIMQKCENNVWKKMSKKKVFHFLKLFFLNENWTFIFVHFWF
jgi:hypothetical protein